MFKHLDLDADGQLTLQELYDLEHDQNEHCIKPFLDMCDMNRWTIYCNSVHWSEPSKTRVLLEKFRSTQVSEYWEFNFCFTGISSSVRSSGAIVLPNPKDLVSLWRNEFQLKPCVSKSLGEPANCVGRRIQQTPISNRNFGCQLHITIFPAYLALQNFIFSVSRRVCSYVRPRWILPSHAMSLGYRHVLVCQ